MQRTKTATIYKNNAEVGGGGTSLVFQLRSTSSRQEGADVPHVEPQDGFDQHGDAQNCCVLLAQPLPLLHEEDVDICSCELVQIRNLSQTSVSWRHCNFKERNINGLVASALKVKRYRSHLQGYEVDVSKWGARKVEKNGGERCPHLDVLSVEGN